MTAETKTRLAIVSNGIDCPCCPPNLARLIASIQTYLLTRDPSGLQVHMPFSGTVATGIPGGSVTPKRSDRSPVGGDHPLRGGNMQLAR